MDPLTDLIGSMTSEAVMDPEGRLARIFAYAFAAAFATGGGIAIASWALG